MPRKYVIGIAVLLAAAGAFLPIGFALQMSWSRAVALEQQSLDNQAQRILQYTQGMLDQTVEVLHRLNAMRIDPCSPQHVRMMQTLSLQERSIDELAYVADGYVRCTSWGIPDDQARLEPPHLHLKNGAPRCGWTPCRW